MEPAKTRFPTRPSFWHPLILIAAGFLAYANSFSCPFLFDDSAVVTKNPHIFHLWPPWLAVLSPTRFVADYSFALNYAWAGFSPAEYRLVNILIHIGAGLLLYGIIRRTLLLPRWNSRFDETAPWLALMTSLLWTVHPLQTESVTYIAQRIEALMGFFFLLTFYCFIRGASSVHNRAWLAASLCVCMVGMGTKEVMVTAPILLFLYDGLFLAPSWSDLVRKRWKLHAVFFSSWLFFMGLLVMGIMRAQAEQVSLFFQGVNRWDYALTQLNVLAHYLRLSVVPYPLCLDYNWPLVHSLTGALWPGVMTFALGVATLWALWQRSWVGFIGAWFFFILAPTSSFSPLPDVAFEHRMYLPLAGVLAFLVVATHSLAGKYRWLCGAIVLSSVVVFTLLTHFRNETYRSQETMWRDVIRKQPANFRTYISLSAALLEEGRYKEVDIICNSLIRRLPPLATLPAGMIQKQFIQPGQPPVALYYAMALNNKGLAALNLNSPEAAKDNYREAIRIFPGAYWARRNLGHALYLENQIDAAIDLWKEALNWQSKDSETHCYLGLALLRKQHYREAVAHFQEAVAIRPDFWFARSQWAWMLATCPANEVRNGPQAVQAALPLLDVSGNHSPRAYDIIAAAYAEAGDFQNAVKLGQLAINASLKTTGKAAPPEPHDYTTATLRQRLELYRNNLPYRE